MKKPKFVFIKTGKPVPLTKRERIKLTRLVESQDDPDRYHLTSVCHKDRDGIWRQIYVH